MPTSLVETVANMGAQEPWPEDAQLFQPYEAEQILLPDNASCLAVQAFLKMCSLPFAVKMRWNAEWLCAGVAGEGRVPVLRCGAFVATELEGAAELVARRGLAPAAQLEPGQRADMRAYMALVSNVLLNAELYVSWLHKETYTSVSRVRCGAVFPWPLSWLQVRARRHRALQRLRAYKWHDHTLEQVLSDVDKCCATLSERLGDQEYFFGVPTELDALVFGHVFSILTTRLPAPLAECVKKHSVLVQHARRIDETYFKRAH